MRQTTFLSQANSRTRVVSALKAPGRIRRGNEGLALRKGLDPHRMIQLIEWLN
jgi:hypothetical protein